MGGAQAVALQPGVSRSGITISMGRWLQFDRTAATRLSFLMSLPIIAGAGLFKGVEVVRDGGIPDNYVAPFLWGMLAAGDQRVHRDRVAAASSCRRTRSHRSSSTGSPPAPP